MDILRKELNSIYDSQHLHEESLPQAYLGRAKHKAEIMAEISGGCTVVTDASCDRCHIYFDSLGVVMGMISERGIYREVNSSDEDEIYCRIHPEDLVEKRMLEYEFFKTVQSLTGIDKTETKAVCRLRMRDRKGNYWMVENSTQIIGLSPKDKIWLILCCYNLSPDQSVLQDINPRIINSRTGVISVLSFHEKRRHVLTEREKEILRLVQDGNASKRIADILGISVHTVNRHRQNIIEKLSVGNSIEAIAAAKAMKLL